MFGKPVERMLTLARQDSEILAVILFGSRARGEGTLTSDVDVCLVLLNRHYDPLHLSTKKLEYLKIGGLDVHIFQQLPLYYLCGMKMPFTRLHFALPRVLRISSIVIMRT